MTISRAVDVGLEGITDAQLRAARGLLNLSVAELSEMTGLAINTIRRAEAPAGRSVNQASANLLRMTLEREGVVFIPADDQGPGVRLAAPGHQKTRQRRREA